ncbi:hypothetical protein [Psychrobacter pygoscelis]|uniref:hypothetical protein n=1 Tax=Psychrobacter pygoscelis TaxID=2488563 RepID=UPI00103E4324|nr:hypothetical protein [Psychrobacter pygoscelis]
MKILYFIPPNYYLSDYIRYYSYLENDILSIKPINASSFEGWLFKYKKNIFSKEKLFVIFENNGFIFVDFGMGAFNLSKSEISYQKQIKRYAFDIIFFKDGQEIYRIHIAIYEWYYWMHDGSSPEMICPINYALDKFENSENWLINFFQSKGG